MTTHEAAVPISGDEASSRQSVRTWILVSFALFVVEIGAWIGFVTVGGVFFTISDAVSLLLGASLIPVVLGLDSIFKEDEPRLARSAKWVGLAAMTLISVGSIVILTSEVSHEFVPAGGGLSMQIAGFALFGVWLLLVGILSGRTETFGRRSEFAAKAVAAGFFLGSLGSPFGPDNVVTILGGVIGLSAYVVWVFSTRADLAGAH
ncbi:MAG: hypothetical protein ACR2NL_02705 [Acidimicrobiia bacterium]